MSIPIKCECGRQLRAKDEFAGTRAECPACGRTLQIPSKDDSREETSPGAGAPAASPSEAKEPLGAGEAPGQSGARPSSEGSRGAGSEQGKVEHLRRMLYPEAIEITEFLDPPTATATAAEEEPAEPKIPVLRRMFEALLDPRSIQWMLMIGGGLCVLGVIVWLVSLGVFKDPLVLAALMGVGTLAILGGGWFVTLKTKFRVAGQALTFLGCVVAPLNLWFYHAQELLTIEGHLWVGGVVCCLLYAATVRVLRDPLFMYAFEAGVTLTCLLLLADLGKITDASFLGLFFMVLGLASVHAERAFSPSEESPLTRRKFGLPLFWSGHVQIAVSLLILLGSQILFWFSSPMEALFGFAWAGNLLTEKHLLASGLWLAAAYVYVYSDLVVRKIGFYLGLAGFAAVMAELTLLLGFDVPAEWIIAVLALTALALNVYHSQSAGTHGKLDRVIPPIGMVLSGLPVLLGILLHIRATSWVEHGYDWSYSTGGEFVVALLVVAVGNRVSAFLCRETDAKTSSVYFFFSAAGLLVAAAGLLRVLSITQWSEQAPLMMLVPISYLVASRLWRGHSAERPLGWVAHSATALILLHVFAASMKDFRSFAPMEGETSSLLLSLVFAEATLFYVLAGLFHRQSANVYLAAAAMCGALWQLMGYLGIDPSYYTLLYAGLGVGCLAIARGLGLENVAVYRARDEKSLVVRGRGLAAFQCGSGILVVACLAAFMQALAGLAVGTTSWLELAALFLTAGASFLAMWIVPSEKWRRFYATAAAALAAVGFLRLNLLIDLNGWQKLEIFCVVLGLVMLVASHVARFRESEGKQDDMVSLGLWFGSLLAVAPLLLAFLYHRFFGAGPSLLDEMALLTVTILMAVTGISWQTKSTTFFGGGALVLYLIVLIVSLTYHPQVAIGVYLAIGGAILFASGIGLSIYRDRLLALPERMANREGIFRILNWR